LVAEFVVIVIGVLVALAVDQYTSARAERDRVVLYLEQLDEELEDMAEKAARERQRYERAFAAATKVVEGLTNEEAFSSDSLTAWFPDVFVVIAWEPESTVLSAMMSSGDIALVDDWVLQSDLIRFRERIRAASGRRLLAEEMFMDGFRAVNQSADMLAWAPGVFGTTGPLQQWSWEDLADDMSFRNGVYGLANGVRNHSRTLRSLEGDIETLREALAQRTRAP
jgi:hypothetical protein